MGLTIRILVFVWSTPTSSFGKVAARLWVLTNNKRYVFFKPFPARAFLEACVRGQWGREVPASETIKHIGVILVGLAGNASPLIRCHLIDM